MSSDVNLGLSRAGKGRRRSSAPAVKCRANGERADADVRQYVLSDESADVKVRGEGVDEGHASGRCGTLKLRIPNPHYADIGPVLLMEILRQAGITKEEWENA